MEQVIEKQIEQPSSNLDNMEQDTDKDTEKMSSNLDNMEQAIEKHIEQPKFFNLDSKQKLTIKILQEGDQVLNVSYIGTEIHIVVRQKNEEVSIYTVYLDENGQPKLSKKPVIIITHGDGVVQALAIDPDGNEVFSLTA